MKRTVVIALVLAACGGYRAPFVVVEVDGALPAPITLLHVTAALASSTRTLDLAVSSTATASFATGFSLELPSGTSGPLSVRVDALDGSQSIVAGGETSVMLAGNNQYTATVVLHSWQTVTLDPSLKEVLLGVWSASPTDTYAVGTNDTILHSVDGKTFAREVVPSTCAGCEVGSVWADAASGVVWAAGGNDAMNTGWILRKAAGGAWADTLQAPHQLLLSVFGFAGGEVYVCGRGGALLHSSNGQTFDPQPTVPNVTVNSVWGADADDVLAVGAGGHVLSTHTRGASWTDTIVPGAPSLANVWGSSRDDVYVVTFDGSVLHSVDDGTTWQGPSLRSSLCGSCAAPPGQLWFANGGSSARDVFAAGSCSAIFHSADQGHSWLPYAAVPPMNVVGFSGSSSNAFAVGRANLPVDDCTGVSPYLPVILHLQ